MPRRERRESHLRVEVTEKHMRKIAFLDMAAARSNPHIQIAVVADNESGRLLNEHYKKYSGEQSPWSTKLFENVEDARGLGRAELRGINSSEQRSRACRVCR